MASSNGRDSKVTASVDSLKLSSKGTSICSSKRPSSESILSKKDRECVQMQECKKKLLSGQDPPIIIRDEGVILRSPPVKKITLVQPTVIPEELAAAAPAQRNWRGILIALLVIAAVLGLIVFSIALLTPANDGKGSKGRRPTRQDVLGNKFKSPPFNGTWLSDTELVFRDQWGGLVLFNVNNYTRRSLMTNTTFRELNAVDFKVSPDLHFVLLLSDIKMGWRYARFAKYYVYEVLTRNKYPLSPIEEDRHAPPLQYAEWAPNGGGGVVFVYQNDIYYKPKVHKKLVCRITNSGEPGVIFNGMPDFLYETEILQQDRALWFSPDGQQLMFMTYNDSQVGEYRYSWYGLSEPETPAYPTIESIRYPKTNTANPVITVFTVSLKTPKFLFPKPLQLTSQVDTDWYIRWLSWISEKQIVLLLLNRPQNVSIISICNIQNYNCQDIVRDESDTTRWSGLGAEPPGDDCGWCGAAPVIHGRGGIISTVPLLDNPDTGYWRHAVHFTQIARTPLTQGDYEVTGLMGWDDNRQILYVMGTLSDTPGERHLYRVRAPTVEGTMWPEQALCLTCPDSDLPAPDVLVEATPLNDEPLGFDNVTLDWVLPSSTVQPHEESNDNETLPQSCLYNRITFSKNFSNFVQECLGPGPPVIWVSGWRGDKKLLLSGGEALRSRVSQLATPQSRVFRVQVGGGRTARVRLLFPPGFKESDDLPLPLVLQVDGSPGSQLISEKFQIDWSWYLASTRNFIVAQIDARGSGFQGEDLRTAIYHKLLSVDIEDQIAVLSYLRDTLKIVDGTRIGVWGSGYGAGAALALAADDLRNVTRCVVALTPITDLLHHISFWTERYGGWGGRWRGSLESTAVWRRAGNLPPRRLLLAQALADTRHHAAHTLHLARALVKADALYMHLVYPDETHLFEKSEMHLYRQIEEFFDECFGPVDLADWDNDVGNFFAFRD